MGKHKELVTDAENRGYFWDKERHEYILWHEGATHAFEVHIKQSGEIEWGVYGPDDRFGFFSLLSRGSASDLETAEMAARSAWSEVDEAPL